MKRWLMWVACVQGLTFRCAAMPASSLVLACDLAGTGDRAAAALEFRRLAMEAVEPSTQGAFYWMAAYEYWQAGRDDQTERMLSATETAAPTMDTPVYFLRGENARRNRRLGVAETCFERILATGESGEIRRLVARRLAAVRLQQGDYEGARGAIAGEQDIREVAFDAIGRYQRGHDKSPAVGGLLGLVPGLGYAYAGEYGNAFRSLLVNALCVWGIVSFSDDDKWGGVAVTGFAELIFYTGSVYGGCDAADRYNQARLNAATQAIEGRSSCCPDYSALPILSLKVAY